MDKTPVPEHAERARRAFIKRRLLWSSDRDAAETSDYYADSLYLVQIDDGKWCLCLSVSGHVVELPIKNIEKYV